MRTVCAWCGKPLRPGDGDAPVSHGMCAACAGESGVFPVEELLSMTAAEFDLLPFGIVELDATGTVLSYNRAEERLAGFDRARFLGKNFFTQVAPCTQVALFQGQYEELTRSAEVGEREFSFVFRFATGERLVAIHLLYDPAGERGIIAVRAAG